MRKIVFRIIGLLLLAILLLAIAIPYFFKDDVIAALKGELSEYVDARVDFKDVSIGLFSNFPNLTVDVEDLSVIGNAPFEGVKLYEASSTAVVVDLASAFDKSTPYKVNAIILKDPNINVKVNGTGKANYDIAKSTSDASAAAETGSYAIALDKFQIVNGNLNYSDAQGNMYAAIAGLNHTSKGDFTEDVFDVKSSNKINGMTIKTGGVKYADNWSVVGDVNVNVNVPQNVYTFKDNTIKINDLDMAYNGDVKMDGAATRINLDFSAPNNSLKSILSLIPSIYSDDFSQLKATGNTTLSGVVSGVYQDGVSYPAIDFNASIDNGMIQYPDLPEQITGLNAQMMVKGSDSKLRDLMVNVPTFSMKMGGEPINGRCKIENVMGNPDISAILDGKLDLGMLSKFVEIEDVQSMSGIADTHIELDATYAAIEAQDYQAISFNGIIDAKDIKVAYANYPTFQIPSGKVTGSPSQIKLDRTNIKAGNSDMTIDFDMNNPLGYILTNQKSNANFSLTSKVLDLNELMEEDASSDSEGEEVATDFSETDSYAENLKLDYNVNIGKIAYDEYNISNLKSRGRYENANTRIEQLDMNYMGSQLSTNGNLQNMYGYATKGETLTGDINFSADKINVNDFMSDEEAASASTADSEVIPVPDNIDLTLKTNIRQLQYEEYDLRDVNGSIIVKENVAQLVGFNGNTMGGNIKIDGTYDTRDMENPMYKFQYDIKQLALQEAFKKSEAIRILAPIAEYINGNFNSNSSFEGRLGKDMMPDFSTITADGFLETIRSTVLNFPILDKIGSTLGIKELKTYEIKDSRNWFTIKDGAIEVEEHAFSHSDMNFKVGGKHYINQSIDYVVKAEIPRDKLEKSNIAGVANSGLDWLNQQTASKGLNLSVGDYVYMDIKIGGTLKNPTIKIIPTGAGGKNLKDQVVDQVKDQANAVKDKVMTRAEAEVERRKQEAMAKGQQEVDKVKEQVTERVNQEVEKGKEVIKEKAKEVVKEQVVDTLTNVVKDKVGEVLGDQAKDEVDKVKDKLKDINPFKKKKND